MNLYLENINNNHVTTTVYTVSKQYSDVGDPYQHILFFNIYVYEIGIKKAITSFGSRSTSWRQRDETTNDKFLCMRTHYNGQTKKLKHENGRQILHSELRWKNTELTKTGMCFRRENVDRARSWCNNTNIINTNCTLGSFPNSQLHNSQHVYRWWWHGLVISHSCDQFLIEQAMIIHVQCGVQILSEWKTILIFIFFCNIFLVDYEGRIMIRKLL